MKTPATQTPAKPLADARSKIAVLTGLFEKLVAEAGSRRRQIERLLNELNHEAHSTESNESRGRAA